MKTHKINRLITAMAAVALLLTGCDPENLDQGPELSVNPVSLTFPVGGDDKQVTLTTNRDWTITIPTDSPWLVADKLSGGPGTYTVTFSAAEYSGSAPRTTSVSIAASIVFEMLAVSQDGTSGPLPTDAIWTENAGNTTVTQTYGSGSQWPYLDQLPSGFLTPGGTGGASVTYTGSSLSVRANTYSLNLDPTNNHFFFSSGTPYFQADNIPVTGMGTGFLSFWTSKQNSVQTPKFTTVVPSELVVSVKSNLDADWQAVTYTAPSAADWVQVTDATFNIPAGATTLSIKWTAGVASVYRLDDISFAATAGGETGDPLVTTGDATNVTKNSATIAGSYTAGTDPVNAAGLEWKADGGTYTAVPLIGTSFTHNLTGLTGNTTYYYRAYATTASGTVYGAEKSFYTVDAVWYERVGTIAAEKDGSGYFPVVTSSSVSTYTYDTFDKLGSGAASVAYTGTSKVSVRTTMDSEGYTDASGVNSIFFSNDTPENSFEAAGIAVTGGSTYTLTFGISKSASSTTFAPVVPADMVLKMKTNLSATETDVTYTNSAGGAWPTTWALATATITVPSGATSLTLKWYCNVASVYRMDDFLLLESTPAPPVLSFGTPALAGTMTSGTAFAAANKITVSYENATAGGITYSVAATQGGSPAAGLTSITDATGTLTAGSGTLEIPLAAMGTPTASGDIVFTITSTGTTALNGKTASGTVHAPAGVLAFGTPVIVGTMTQNTAFAAGNKLTITYENATAGSITYSVAATGIGAAGLTAITDASGTLVAGSSTLDIPLAAMGTPTGSGAITFTITSTGTAAINDKTVSGTVNAAGGSPVDFTAYWNMTDIPDWGVSPMDVTSLAPTGGLTVGGLTKTAFTTSGSPGANNWGSNDFSANTEANRLTSPTKYATFVLTPASGKSISLTSLELIVRLTATGPLGTSIQYQIGSGSFVEATTFTYTKPTSTTTQAPQTADLSDIAALQHVAVDVPVTIRMVPYLLSTQSGTVTGNWYITNNGTQTANPLVITGSTE